MVNTVSILQGAQLQQAKGTSVFVIHECISIVLLHLL